MDRRSWLWRRKSSEKSPGETESSGSISSHSERFSDDQACITHSSQSPEAASKALHTDEEVNDSVKALTEKLSAALLNISAKEDLVKQHAKVAEEAVSGWEKAEKEVSALKQQLELTVQKNSALEDRLGHLDGALKECVRQLRQAREEQEQRIREAISKKTCECESMKSELERELAKLRAQLETAKAQSTMVDSDLRPRLEASEKENSALKLELLCQAEELELRIIERDLSNQAAETSSKQHLESIKKLAKVEAECRRLKALARKASPANDQKSFTASTIYLESFTDSQSDSGERLLAVDPDTRKVSSLEINECEPSQSDSWVSARITELDQFKNEKTFGRNLMVPSVEINLMDDFLEMEKLAALPDTESASCCPVGGPVLDQRNSEESPLKAELSAMINRTADLEEKLEKMEAEKMDLKMAFTESEQQLETSKQQLKEAEVKLAEFQTQLSMENKSKQAVEEELKAANVMIEKAESRHGLAEVEIATLQSKVASLEEEVKRGRALLAENVANRQKFEDELLKMKHEAELQREAELRRLANTKGESKIMQEKELALAASKFAECQKTIASLGRQLKSLATLEDFLIDAENPTEEETDGPKSGLYLSNVDSDSSKILSENIINFSKKNGNEMASSNPVVPSGKSRNGHGKFYHGNKNEIR